MFRLSDIIASIGVAILLLAFLLNLLKKLQQDSVSYSVLNIIGAGFACYASWLIHFWPFVVLEGAWCLAAAVALFKCER
jgi:hypothetical protein